MNAWRYSVGFIPKRVRLQPLPRRWFDASGLPCHDDRIPSSCLRLWPAVPETRDTNHVALEKSVGTYAMVHTLSATLASRLQVPAQPCRAVPPSRTRRTRTRTRTRTRAPAESCSSATCTDSRHGRDHGPSSIWLRVPVPGLHSTPGLGSATGGPRKMGKWKNGSSVRRPQVSHKSVRDWGPGAVVAGSMSSAPERSIRAFQTPKTPSLRAVRTPVRCNSGLWFER